MAFGIGGGGFMGIAHEVLGPPLLTSVVTAASGGTITAGTYRYLVTAINANGETHGIADGGGSTGGTFYERSITTTGSTSTVTLTWPAVSGATGYKLYKTAAAGASGTELLYKTVGLVTTDIDTAPGTPTGAFPNMSSATAPNTYTAPTKFFPFLSESLKYIQDTQWRRPIRTNVDVLGAVAGNVHVEGDVEIEGLEDVIPWFLMNSRTSVTKTGTSPNFTYTFVPTQGGSTTGRTSSITVVRNNQIYGYTGMNVSSFRFTIDNGMLKMNMSFIGSDEATQTLPVPTYTTTTPFGAGQYNLQIPTATQIFDADSFDFQVDDNGEPQYRLKDTGRGAQYVKYGERTLGLSMERDFLDRTEYDAFKALTAQSITLTATKGANNSVAILMPSVVKDTYEVGLSGQGDIVRAAIAYMPMYDPSTSKAYQITVKTQENIF